MTKQEQIEEIAKFVCNSCEMKFCIDGDCAVGNDYKTCGISQETAEYIYNAGYRKIDEVRKETAKGIYGQIEKSDILIVNTQEYGEIEVVSIERLNEIFRSKGVEVEE